MQTLNLPPGCPFEFDGNIATVTISTDSGVLVLADNADGAEQWEDLLYDGTGHSHHDGGFAVAGRSVGTHVPYDGRYTLTLVHDAAGQVQMASVSLQHIADTLHDVDHHVPGADTPASHDHGHGHGAHPDGWSAPYSIALSATESMFGDPVGLLDGEAEVLARIQWPNEPGMVSFTAHAHDGFRDTLVFAWSSVAGRS